MGDGIKHRNITGGLVLKHSTHPQAQSSGGI